jgi:hypothetical protein
VSGWPIIVGVAGAVSARDESGEHAPQGSAGSADGLIERDDQQAERAGDRGHPDEGGDDEQGV